MPSKKSAAHSFAAKLERKVRIVNVTLRPLVSDKTLVSPQMRAPLSYALEGPGKRIRPAVVMWCCELLAGRVNRNAEIAAAAIEMVHTYSLVHDDLPAMDDDDFRRGRPTSHRKFDEATAILAGDGLLTLAFEVLAKETSDASIGMKLVAELAGSAGPAGMVAGQLADLHAEHTRAGRKALEYIHLNKTAKMFRAAAGMGAICGGASEVQLRRLREYGLKLGLGFQIADDILDVCGTTEQLGKTGGKDAAQGKATYPAIIGMK